MPKITSIFAKLSKVTVPSEITQEDYKVIGKFVIVLYSTTTNTDDINSARWMLFTRGGQSIENISPTGEALKQKQRRKQACGMAVWRNNALTIIQLIWAGKNLMKNISCFGAIYLVQKRLAGNLSNAVARNHVKADPTVAS